MLIAEQIAYEQAFEILLIEIALSDERHASQIFSALCRIQDSKSKKISVVVFDEENHHKFVMITTLEDKLLQIQKAEKLSEVRRGEDRRAVWVSKTASFTDLMRAARLIIKSTNVV